MKMINKAVFSMLIVGSASFFVFGMEDRALKHAVQAAATGCEVNAAGPNLLDMPVYVLGQIFSQYMQGFDLSNYEELKAACKGLCRLREVCKAFRDFLTPLEIANILNSKGLGVAGANESLLHETMLKHDHEMTAILIWTNPVEKRGQFLMNRNYSWKQDLGSPSFCSGSTVLQRCYWPEIARQLLRAVPEGERTAVVMATDDSGFNALHSAAFVYGPFDIYDLFDNHEDYKKRYAEKARVLIDLLPAAQREAVLVAKNQTTALLLDMSAREIFAKFGVSDGAAVALRKLYRLLPEGCTALDMAAREGNVQVGRVLLELYRSLGIEVPHDEAITSLIACVEQTIQMDKARNEMRESVKRYPALALTPCCNRLILKSDLESLRQRKHLCPTCKRYICDPCKLSCFSNA